jgi:hypothetical protein
MTTKITKTALLNAKFLGDDSDKPETLNICLANEKIIGLGYVPDDDDFDQIDAQDHVIMLQAFNLNSALTESSSEITNNGISLSFLVGDDSSIIFIDQLAYNLDKLSSVQASVCLIFGKGSASEALFVTQEFKKTPYHFSLHFIIETNELNTIDYMLTQSSDSLSFGLLIDTTVSLHMPTIQTLLNDTRLLSLSTTDSNQLLGLIVKSCPDNFYSVMTSFFKRSLTKLFPAYRMPLALSKTASFALIPNSQDLFEKQGCLVTVSKGKIYR